MIFRQLFDSWEAVQFLRIEHGGVGVFCHKEAQKLDFLRQSLVGLRTDMLVIAPANELARICREQLRQPTVLNELIRLRF
jgi:hypothetical protein